MDAGVSVTIIEEALAEVLAFLRSAPITPRIRELRARATTYDRVVSGWPFRPPTPAQCKAMLECVMEIHATVLGPTKRSMKPPAAWGGARSTPSRRPTMPPSARSPMSWPPEAPSSRSMRPISQPPISRPHTRTTQPPPMPSEPPASAF